MKLAVRILIVVAALVSCGHVLAQDNGNGNATAPAVSAEKAAPVLTTEQKQAIQIIAQKIEIAQLRAQAAQAEFDKARTEIGVLVQTLQKEGFDLDLQTLTYTPKKAEKK